jgi:hypothetical protein
VSRAVGFAGDRNRLNVALNRAQKVLIITGTSRVWSSDVTKVIHDPTGKWNKFLLDLLRDVTCIYSNLVQRIHRERSPYTEMGLPGA